MRSEKVAARVDRAIHLYHVLYAASRPALSLIATIYYHCMSRMDRILGTLTSDEHGCRG